MFFPRRKKGNKLNAKKVIVDGIEFDSKRESERYKFLKWAQDEGIIHDLQHHVKFALIAPTYKEKVTHYKTKPDKVEKIMDMKHKGITYEADFVYMVEDRKVVEDVKSSKLVRKDVFNLKKQLMWAIHGIDIKEIYQEDLKKL